jgi:hypothetical protein
MSILHSIRNLFRNESYYPYQIFCDLDGVLINFTSQALNILNDDIKKRPEKELSKDKKLAKRYDEMIERTQVLDIDEIKYEHIRLGGKGDPKVRDYMYARLMDEYLFWSELPWRKDGKELWNFIEKHHPYILTSPMDGKGSREGKIQWCKTNLNINRQRVHLAKKKHLFALQNDSMPNVLIDDTEEKIDNWVAHGGIGILHKNTESTVKRLREIEIDSAPPTYI